MDLNAALDILSAQGGRLKDEFGLAWGAQAQQTVCALRFRRRTPTDSNPWGSGGGVSGPHERQAAGPTPAVVAVVGGASSGKSTVFNNLLGGQRASLVTIKSHATRGLILAGHEAWRAQLDAWLYQDSLLFPSLVAKPAGGGTDLRGEPQTVCVLCHDLVSLRDVILIDTPDFTSNAAEREGDVTLSMLPWFDRVLIVMDHERWFDRQIVSDFAAAAERFGQRRMVVFNRTVQGQLAPSDRAQLEEKARQIKADGSVILDYYPGRGFRRFAPEVAGGLVEFATGPVADRTAALSREAASQAERVLEVNRQRVAELDQLRRALTRSAGRLGLATWWECVTAMMAPAERERLDVFARMLGLSQMRDWVERQRRRIERTMSKLPWVRLGGSAPEAASAPAEVFSREQSGLDFFESQCERQRRRLNEDAAGSDFWGDLRRSTGRQPALLDGGFTEGFRPRAREAALALGAALEAWDAKVQRECQGLSPYVTGSLSAVTIGVVAILAMVPGPITAITHVVALGAIKAGLIKIGAAGVFGAIGGRPAARLVEIAREKLLGSAEFNAVRDAAEAVRRLVDEHAQVAVGELERSARRLTLTGEEPLREALEKMRGTK